MKNKRAIINPKKNDDKCFQYAITLALNHQYIKHSLQEIYSIRPYIKKHDWNEIKIPSHKRDWSKLEKNNKTIAINVLFVPYNIKQIKQAYISKHNSDRERRKVTLLMILMLKNGIIFL